MKLIHRRIQVIHPGMWDELAEMEKKWEALENRIGGFPPKRRYRILFGGDDAYTHVWEQEWESWDAWVEAVTKRNADPEFKKLNEGANEIVKKSRSELYMPFP